ncbi:MAG: TolC family protein [Lentisphaeria bacterium]|nr:TolC family protein [Lentisphaeria bacterium]
MMQIILRRAAARRAAFFCFLLWCLLFGLPAAVCAQELAGFLREAEQVNPGIQAASWRVEQALLKHQELLEFLDPSFTGAIGASDDVRGVPGAVGYSALVNNGTEAQLGVQIPVPAGAYVTLGSALRVLDDTGDYDYLYQTLYGVKVRIPLLRDRAFRKLSISRSQALAEYNVTVAALLRENQVLRRDVELAYISAYETLSSYRVTQAATARFQALLDETRELCRLKVVPEYQINQALLELQIGREDEEKARNRLELNLVALARSMGVDHEVVLAIAPEEFFRQALQSPVLTGVPFELACHSRGNFLEVLNLMKVARSQMDSAQEEAKDDVSLNFGVTWLGEGTDHPFESKTLTTDHHLGGEVTVVWSRSLDYRGPRARQARFQARVHELSEQLRSVGVDIRAEIRNAELNYRAAITRLELVNQGIAAAQDTVAAEQERFRLGESTSKNVTDAQKNLTTILQRQATAAADLLRARANYLYAIGYREEAMTTATPEQP